MARTKSALTTYILDLDKEMPVKAVIDACAEHGYPGVTPSNVYRIRRTYIEGKAAAPRPQSAPATKRPVRPTRTAKPVEHVAAPVAAPKTNGNGHSAPSGGFDVMAELSKLCRHIGKPAVAILLAQV